MDATTQRAARIMDLVALSGDISPLLQGGNLFIADAATRAWRHEVMWQAWLQAEGLGEDGRDHFAGLVRATA